MPAPCSLCQAPNATSICSRCKSVYYCNSECQRKQWKEHKKVCQKSSKISKPIANDANPTPNSKRLIPCKYFGSARGCNRRHCKYSHENPNSVPFCSHYFSGNGCKFNKKCKFRHKYDSFNQPKDQDSILHADTVLRAFDKVITLFSMQCIHTEHDIDFNTFDPEVKIDALLNAKVAETRYNPDKKSMTMHENLLQRVSVLRDFYYVGGLLTFKEGLDKEMNESKELYAAEGVTFYYAIFNSVIMMSQIIESIKFYERKFQQKNVYQIEEFGAMYCQYYYCKDQERVLLSMFVRGEFIGVSLDTYLTEYYFTNHDDGGYAGLIPADLCEELACQLVKPWEEDVMAVIGVLYMDQYPCVIKKGENFQVP